MKILVIEDEREIADSLQEGLQSHRYTVDVAYDAGQGYDLNQDHDYDVILLDLMLPDMNGEDLCRTFRKEGCNSFILMLTAKKDLSNIVEGLDCGADDYLTKPFQFTELLARIRALLRRTSENKQNILRAGDIVLDLEKEEVTAGGKSVKLTKKEYMILEYLLRNAGNLVSRNQLLEHAWDRNVDIFTNVVDTHMKNLRRKLGKPARIIKTRYGSGYRIEDEKTVA